MKAFSYLRTSGKSQKDNDGFPRQRDKVLEYSTVKGIEIVREFCDEGVSGTLDAFDREGLTNLFAEMKANGVRTVLIERADRLARDLMVSEVILSEFRKIGASVIAVDGDNDLTVPDQDPTRTLMRQMLGAIAQWEKTVIVQKTRAARIRIRKEKGRCEGRKPYGFRVGEQEQIALMREWRERDELTFSAIANRLNGANVKPRNGGRWHSNTVCRILGRD